MRSVHHVFEDRAAATPHAVAVVSGDERVTYAQLDARANQFAHRLRERGVSPDDRVGVLLRRGPDMVAALLGVWKAGAAYVPLDPDLPAERLGYYLATAGVQLVITESPHAGALREYDGRALWTDREDWADPTTAVERWDDQYNLAYVIFTSGSTGKPKGVQIAHRALLNLLFSLRVHLGAAEGDGWLASTSLSFDISGLELWLPLITGGRVVLAGDGETKDAAALIRLVDTQQVSHVQATPSGWKLLLAAGFGERPVTALVGGEALPPVLARTLAGQVKRLVNVYGPTETTIWSTFWDVPADAETVLIGRPLHNTRTYVLDADLRPVAVAVTGELYLGGDGVARGYVGRPDLTAERFLPEPFGGAPGARMYRTGDLARYRADGTIEFLGRVDHQVKVRGHRIELGEIEERLITHPQVRDACVLAREDAQGEKWLVGYVVGDAEGGELRGHLAEALPGYMIPAAFVHLDVMPLNAAGKVDRQALPAPDRAAMSPDRAYVAPATETEALLARVCAAVLGIEQVGMGDRLMDLGVDSMRIVHLLAALREGGKEASLRQLYRYDTLADLALGLDGGRPRPLAPARKVPTQRGAVRLPSPLGVMADHNVPGVSVAVLRDGEVALVESHGVLRAGGGEPVTARTPFQVASMSKHVTAFATLRLAEQGMLDLDADVNRYLTDWRVPAGGVVTVRGLLSNTSGLSQSPSTLYEPGQPVPGLLDELRDRDVRPELAPGTVFRKTNSHFAVLQQVLTDLVGRPFPELMTDLVFTPLGMADSSFDQRFPQWSDSTAAAGHDEDGAPVPGGYRLRTAVAAGGLWSTAADLARVACEIRNAARHNSSELLTRLSAEQLLTVVLPGSFYGLGTIVDDSGADTEFGHGGESTGFRCMTMTRLNEGSGLVVLTNSESGREVHGFLADALRGQDVKRSIVD
ncbi:hypothetical protein Lfu02_10400 [Longispora fulva]|uniref:Amino acid adenylation domain-containing protein n=1 Tax=Longispora fulva TaxID=619741 RepID=A0A8J7GEK8_9ACTN|nr:amino acid adenylation domain-containing protein [Longispora fulva]MBG6135097.1 amino acid adenylation domain-containing protein [Longispora fulva]GIG56668.1 hypothetical protein Lfu02_10400 [Longispora fulva]